MESRLKRVSVVFCNYVSLEEPAVSPILTQFPLVLKTLLFLPELMEPARDYLPILLPDSSSASFEPPEVEEPIMSGNAASRVFYDGARDPRKWTVGGHARTIRRAGSDKERKRKGEKERQRGGKRESGRNEELNASFRPFEVADPMRNQFA